MAAMFQHERRNRIVLQNTEVSIPLPEKRIFHIAFMPFENGDYFASDIRAAYYQGKDDSNVKYVLMSGETINEVLAGKIWVSASFVTPYPPGFPVIVPGQIITIEILHFFQHLKVKEIHGFSFDRGFKVFHDNHLLILANARAEKNNFENDTSRCRTQT